MLRQPLLHTMLWALLAIAGIAFIWFLEQEKINPTVPDMPNETQVEMIAEYHTENTPLATYTHPVRGVVYEFKDGTFRHQNATSRVVDGNPALTKTQAIEVGNESTLEAPPWVNTNHQVITVRWYNNFIGNLQGMVVSGCIAGFLVGGVIGIARGDWLVMAIAEISCVGLLGLGFAQSNLLLMIFAIGMMVVLPFSRNTFYGGRKTK